MYTLLLSVFWLYDRKMSNRDFDLNLLKVLVVLLQEQNTSRAADVLNTSQPSVSRALAKLRTELNDPLFIRDKQGLRLSPKAELLAETLPKIYQKLLDTFEEGVFQPESYNGKIKIAMNAYITEIYGFRIYQQLKHSMPGLTVELLSWNERSIQQILDGQVDIAISFLPMSLLKGIYEKPVDTLCFGFIANRHSHEEATSIDIVDAIKRYPLCTVLIPEYNAQSLRFEKQSKIKQEKLNIILKGHSIRPMLDLVEHTDTLFIAPKKLYERIDKHRFCFLRIDNFGIQNKTATIGLIYNTKNRSSPVYKYIEQEIIGCIQA